MRNFQGIFVPLKKCLAFCTNSIFIYRHNQILIHLIQAVRRLNLLSEMELQTAQQECYPGSIIILAYTSISSICGVWRLSRLSSWLSRNGANWTFWIRGQLNISFGERQKMLPKLSHRLMKTVYITSFGALCTL